MSGMIYLKGLGMGASLIMAIGAQNAHVLRMGLQRSHVATTVFVCILGDALLITAGALGVGTLITQHPALLTLARWSGAAFLAYYGWRSLRAAWGNNSLKPSEGSQPQTWHRALLTVAALTFLNPHVYLDTVLLLGAIGGQYLGTGKWWFAGGAGTASLLWFSSLGWGARLLAPLFSRPIAWRALDGLIALIMCSLALSLVRDAIAL